MAGNRLRFLLPLAAFATPAYALADAPTAEEALEIQHRQLQRATGTAPCEKDTTEDIVVCGRRGPDPNRLAFPDEREPGERVGLIPGEPPSGRAALEATAQSPCTTVGRNQHCGGGLPVFQTLFLLAKIGKHVIDPEE